MLYTVGQDHARDLQLLLRAQQAYEQVPVPGVETSTQPIEVLSRASRALVWHEKDGTTIVAIRGTSSDLEAALDVNTQLVKRSGHEDKTHLRMREWFMLRPALVHAGFATALDDLKQAGLLEAIRSGGARDLILTGHSLGGAIAILLGVDLARRKGTDMPSHISVITWGAPQVGTEAFRKVAQSTGTRLRITRVENGTDLVTQMPGVFGEFDPELASYTHVGERFRLDDGDLVDQALKYLQRAIHAVSTARDGFQLLAKVSAHSLDAYRDNLISSSKPPFERMVEKGMRVAAFSALAAHALADRGLR